VTVVITATQEPDNVPPRVRLNVSTSGTATALFTVVRTDPDGRDRRVILSASQRFTSSAAVVYDYHAPFNQPVAYTATSEAVSGTSTSVTLAVAVPWLIHRTNSTLSVQLDAIASIGDQAVASTAATHFAYGAKYPVTRNEAVRRALSGSLDVRCDTKANRDAVEALLSDSGVILCNFPEADGQWMDVTWAWIQPGDYTRSNKADWSYHQYRHVTFPFQVTDTPAGNLSPEWTWADVTALGTWTDIQALYDNWGDVIIDYRTP
jgi:hypothetical protein